MVLSLFLDEATPENMGYVMNKRDIKTRIRIYPHGFPAIVANDAKAHNLEQFNQSQQRIKARHSQAQNRQAIRLQLPPPPTLIQAKLTRG